jgi:hypothetical protein
VAEKLHSNYEIRWQNFRRFDDTNWVTIKPLTILLGANNGGKSSILSPLLLMAQTLASSDRETPLLPFGPLIDLGSYRDFVHLHDTSRDLTLGIRFHIHPPKGKLKEVGTYPPGGLQLRFAADTAPERVKLTQFDVTDIYDRPYFSRVPSDAGFTLDGVISSGKMTAEERKALERAEPMNFLFSPNDVFYELDALRAKDVSKKPSQFTEQFSHYLKAVGFTYSSLRAFFEHLSYVGPLRAKLQRFYRVSPELPDTVGAQGEHAANLFRRRAEELKPKIDAWVKKFEFGDELRYASLAPDLFQLTFKSGDEETNVADAGFGASQVLPLIIQAVAAPHNSLTIAEQPEIHLNPRLQCVLADLFVDMAGSGHRVLVETHSEHMIVRLRRLIAEGKVDADDINVLFVERSGSVSTIRPIPIDKHGTVSRDAWPVGFFEDGLREALALASAQARPAKKVIKRERKNASR